VAANHVRRETGSTRAFRALLALYPAAFRDEYHRELMLVFLDRYRYSTSRWDRARLWLEASTGILAEAPKEHARMVLQDLRYALRVLRQRPFVTATIVITLGLGIGANTAMFSLLNAVVLRTLPVSDPEQLYAIKGTSPLTASSSRFSGPTFERLRTAVPEGTALAAMSRVARVYVRADQEREMTPAALQLVSPDYFRVLAATPVLGGFSPAKTPGAPSSATAAVVSHAYWQRRLGGADIIGRTLTINGTDFAVAGVGPPGFTGVWLESPVDVWVPLPMQGAVKYSQNYSMDGADPNRPWVLQERVWWLDVIARIPHGKATMVAGALNTSVEPFTKGGAPITLERFAQGASSFRQRFTTPLFALIAMAALVMLIACANIANLLLAQAARRQREMAVRMSLGAGRARLLQQLLTEGVLLVALGTAAALLFAQWAGDLIVRTATDSLDGTAPFAARVDLRAFAFTAAVAFASVLLFGLLPAWRASRVDLVGALNAGGRGAAGSSTTRPARILVVLQVALSLVLVAGTGLLVRGFQSLLDLDLGFDRQRLLSVTIDPRLSQIPKEAAPELYRRLVEGVEKLPGVQSAALAMCGLQSGCRAREDGMVVEGYRARGDEQIEFTVNMVSPDYFSTTGMRLIAGRSLEDGDAPNGPKVAVVNKTLALKYFADGQAVGRHFGEGWPDVEIVGIVDDGRLLNVKEPPVPSVFFSLTQRMVAARQLEVRTTGDPRLAAAAVRKTIREVAPDLPIERIVTMEDRIRQGLSQERLIVSLTSGFGALALGLAGFGLFGLLSYTVARRTSEFGLRMALGASRISVLWSVVREAVWLVLLGCLLGLPFVMTGGDFVSKLFVGVRSHDWPMFAAATGILVAVGCACSAVPALRASRVDPMVALRDE
jgi:putative ABC transport system permease protein